MRRYCALVIVLTGLINLLALAGAIYMLQVYDRVLTSQSIPTLVALTVLIFGAYLAFGVLDVLRSQILFRVGLRIDRIAMPLAHGVLLRANRRGFGPEDAVRHIKDVDTLRTFLGSAAPLALVDLLWVPLYLGFLWLISPPLALLTSGGIGLLILLSLVLGFAVRRREEAAASLARGRTSIADAHLRNADLLTAMGLGGPAGRRFHSAHAQLVKAQTRVSDLNGGLGATLRVLRLMLQSAIVGLGAYLVIENQLTAGAIIAASLAAARAVAPIETAVVSWSSFLVVRDSLRRLRGLPTTAVDARAKDGICGAASTLEVRRLSIAPATPGGIGLQNVQLSLARGQAVIVLGNSRSGKSMLLTAIAGLTAPDRGLVLVDGEPRSLGSAQSKGPSIGFLPQDPQLVTGTIAANIALLREEVDPVAVRTAAQLVGLHDLIQSLPAGYETPIENCGHVITPGIRQRLAIARAFYGEPALVLLDDPSTHLDAPGEACLIRAIRQTRERGGIVVLTATRTSLMAAVDHVAVLKEGRLTGFGEKTRVLTQMRGERAAANDTEARSGVSMS